MSCPLTDGGGYRNELKNVAGSEFCSLELVPIMLRLFIGWIFQFWDSYLVIDMLQATGTIHSLAL